MTSDTVDLRRMADVVVSNVDKKTVDGDVPVRLVNYTDVYYRDIISPELELMNATASPTQIARFQLKGGDTLLTKDSETAQDIGVPAYVECATSDMVCGYHLAIIRPNAGPLPKFVYWAMASSFVREKLSVVANGVTRYGLTYDALRCVQLPNPSPTEQQRVSAFLDRQVAAVDAVVERKREEVALLREYASAAEYDLVWHGLTSSPTGASPLPQVDHVPNHWSRLRNKNLLAEARNLSQDGSEELLSVSHITGVTRRADKNVNMFLAETNEGYVKVRPGDLVINTMWAWMGALGVSPLEGIASPAYGVYRPRVGVCFEPDYYDALYRSPAYVNEMTRYSTGVWSSRLRLYPEAFLSLPVVAPPADEQRAIAQRIREVRDSVAPATALLEQSIDLLNERKRALITAAVTGELDPSTMSDRAGKIAIA